MSDNKVGSILVVDDDRDAGRNLGDILMDLGYEVGVAEDGFQALELAQRRQYQIALLDFKMPGMDGLTLAQKLKQLSCSMVVILTTAHASRDTLAKAQSLGVWRVYPKPLDLARMVPSLMDVAQRPLVLMIEDDADLCQSMTDLLQDQGYRACYHTNIELALACIRQTQFQVVLIDMKLPGGFGDDVLEQVRGITDSARIVMMTGFRDEVEVRIQRALSQGADAVCYKPFQMPKLLEILQRLTVKTA